MPEESGGLAIAEPVATEISSEATETGVGTTAEGGNASESSNEDGTSVEKPALTEKPGQKGKLNLAEVAKASADQLKAINPALPSAIQKAAYELRSLYGEFPGGLKEAVALKNTLGEYGGLEGIKETVETVTEFGNLAKAFLDGKPDFVDNLIKESPAAFSQMMPDGLAKWKANDPESYNHHQAKVFVQTLDQHKFSDTLEKLWTDAKDQPTKDALAYMWQQIDGMRKMGEKSPERKVDPKNEQYEKREKELAAREEKAFLAPIATVGKQQIGTILEREMAAGYQWGKTDAEVRDEVKRKVQEEVIKISKKDPTFGREFERLKGRGDSERLQSHIKDFQERVTPNIVQRVARLFNVAPKNAGAQSGVKKPVPATPAASGPESTAWVRISGQPKFKDMDTSAMGRNYEDLIMSNKAILRDGRRVQWA